ncbi:MAG TPA: PadR family transcriptional regulator [Kineosporiaceae bacterium]|nr:PadR family transcriptional regulator [Kineosporiaceae bacterium]
MTEDHWPTEWLRAALSLCVLACLDTGPAHGYAVAQRLSAAGLGTVKGGTLYPLLGRLEADGLVTARWEAGEAGPGRKQYTLTPAGRVELDRRRRQWREFHTVTEAVLGEDSASTGRVHDQG